MRFRHKFLLSVLTTAFFFNYLISPYAIADEFTQEEIDLPDDFQGTAVSVKFSDEDAVHDYDGQIDSYSGELTFGMANTVWASGEVFASVLGSGSGLVQTSSELLFHGEGGSNIGNSSQSLKPFVVAGSGSVASSITIDFDGLLVLKEDSLDAADNTQARVDFFAAIEQFNAATGERETVGSNEFEGMAFIEQSGAGGDVEINVPETFNTVDFPDEFSDNTWFDNDNLTITEVVAAGAGTGQMNVADLPADTQADATTHLNAGRAVYYLLYSETFNFDATGGQTYFVYMDLNTSTTATDGDFSVTTYAASDFSNTISFSLGGGSFTTLVNIEGNQTVAGDDQFGGSSSQVTLDDADLTFTANAELNEDFVLAENTSNTFDTGNNSGTLAGDISGGGGLVKAGIGPLLVSGNNTYAGGTTISAGTLELGADDVLPDTGDVTVEAGAFLDVAGFEQTIGGLSGAGDVLLGAGSLAVGNDDGSSTFSGDVQGTGDLTKVGAGTLILSGANSATGDLTVSEGLVRVNGSWAGDTQVGANGAIGGSGTLSGDLILQGLMQPGNSIGLLTIEGNYTQADGSSMEVEFDNSGNSDRLQVDGIANIGADTTIIPVAVERITSDRTYEFLSSNNPISGAFDQIVDNYGILDFSIDVTNPNSHFLIVERVPYSNTASTLNQREIARILEELSPGATGDLEALLARLDLLSVSGIQSGYDDLSPSISPNAGLVARQMQRMVHQEILNRLTHLRHLQEQGSASDPWHVYARGLAGFGSFDDDDQARGAEWQSSGIGVGFDRAVSDNAVIGLYTGGLWSEVDGRDTTGSVDTRSIKVAGYAALNEESYFLHATAGYGYDDNESERTIAFWGREVEGDWDRDIISVVLGGGLSFDVAGATLEPFLYADYVHLQDDAYTETGAGGANVTVHEADSDSLRHILGVRLVNDHQIKGLTLVTKLEVSWAHEYLERDLTKMAGLDGALFNVSSVAPGKDSFRAGGSLRLVQSDRLSLWLGYDAEFNSDADDHVFRLGFDWKF